MSEKHEIPIKELTPKLADKIWKSLQKKMYDEKVSKDLILHHLKQLKAQMGKYKSKILSQQPYGSLAYKTIIDCMFMIDNKIKKITK